MANTKRQIFIGVMIAMGIIVVFGLVKFFQIRSAIAAAMSRVMPPEAVTTFIAKDEQWPSTLSAVGSLAAFEGTTLGAEDFGRVSAVRFTNGSSVNKGDILVEFDTAVEEAQLRGALAQSDLARISLERARKLRAQNVNSIAELDRAEAELRNATASVETLRAQIQRKRVVAPFSGLAGIRQVNEGQIVVPGALVVSLYSLNPLFLDFNLPQQVIGNVEKGMPVRFTVDAFPGRTFEAILTALDPNIDPISRNNRVQATAQNPSGELRPGMFAEATVLLPTSKPLVTIPASSIQYAPYGDMVYVVEKMKNEKGEEYLGVRQQVVKIGAKEGDLVGVSSGIKAGEEVVSSGVFKLRPGAAVAVNNSVLPGAERNPQPTNS